MYNSRLSNSRSRKCILHSLMHEYIAWQTSGGDQGIDVTETDRGRHSTIPLSAGGCFPKSRPVVVHVGRKARSAKRSARTLCGTRARQGNGEQMYSAERPVEKQNWSGDCRATGVR